MDNESQLVDGLTELLYALDDGMIFSDIIVHQVESTSMIGEASGGPTDQPLLKQIKAVTYHMLEIKPTDHGYEVVIVFDV